MRQRRSDTIFVKNHDSRAFEDWERVNTFYEQCQRIPWLRAPKPCWLDSPAGSIGYERLHHLQPLLSIPDSVEDRLDDFGRVLSRFHAEPVPISVNKSSNDEQRRFLASIGVTRRDADVLIGEFPHGFFHGDCWHGNVLVSPERGFVFLDPIPVPWLFHSIRMVASGAIDLSFFYMSLFLRHPLLRLLRLDVNAARRLANVVLNGYLREIDGFRFRRSVIRLSDSLAERYIAEYPKRLCFPIGYCKLLVSSKLHRHIDPDR